MQIQSSLMRIQQLPKILANQIAAGEVIERPASVLKECVENSLDAGATYIEIEIENAGMGLIRIIDNGQGIHKDDLQLALSRHATSKIKKVDDLFCISSLGFRGEALASMASVAKLRLLSRAKDATEAWEIRSDGETIGEPLSCVREVGTTLELRDLFYNVPVRRKFLRSEKTELYHIIDLFKKFALSHFSVGFCLKNNQRRLYTFPKAENESQKLARIKKICGLNFVEQTVYIDAPYEPMRLWGWIGRTDVAKRQAEAQYFFINNRMVRDKLIIHAIKSAYQVVQKDLCGLHPSFLLHLELPANRIDVNVHPTKHEVRFIEASLVHDFIEKCVKEALLSTSDMNMENVEPVTTQAPLANIAYSTPSKGRYSQTLSYSAPKKNDLSGSSATAYLSTVTPAVNVIPSVKNEVGGRWRIVAMHEKLYVIDLLMIKDKIFSDFMSSPISHAKRKPLLFPIRCELPNVTYLMPLLSEVGFLGSQSDRCLSITHIPYLINQNIVQACLNSFAQESALNLDRIFTILLEFINEEALYEIPYDWLYDFLKQWISQVPDKGPWVVLDESEVHRQIKEMQF